MVILISPAPSGWRNERYAFGSTASPYSQARPHKGDDFGYYYANPEASKEVVAPVSGTVVEVVDNQGVGRQYNQGWGNVVKIRVNDRVVVALCHLRSGSISVRVGQTVTAGQRIAKMGNTGDTGGEVHLHFEVWLDGNRVAPEPYYSTDLPGTGGSSAGGGSKPLPQPTPEQLEEEEIMGAKEDILASIDANTARLRLEIRGHIFYDAGPNGDQPFEKAERAALINSAGKILVMSLPPIEQEASWRRDTYKYTDTTRPAPMNRVGLTSGEFWNKIKDELTARSNDFYTVADAQAWFAKRQEQIAAQ